MDMRAVHIRQRTNLTQHLHSSGEIGKTDSLWGALVAAQQDELFFVFIRLWLLFDIVLSELSVSGAWTGVNARHGDTRGVVTA
jgi:hypothetical protein